jgi:hypothetical protein
MPDDYRHQFNRGIPDFNFFFGATCAKIGLSPYFNLF